METNDQSDAREIWGMIRSGLQEELALHREIMKLQHEAMCQLVHEKHSVLEDKLSWVANQFEFDTDGNFERTGEQVSEAILAGSPHADGSANAINSHEIKPEPKAVVPSPKADDRQHASQHGASVVKLHVKGTLTRVLGAERLEFSKLQHAFEALMGVLIIANCALMVAQLQLSGYQSGQTLKEHYGEDKISSFLLRGSADYDYTAVVNLCDLIQSVFNFVFLVELGLRILWFRRKMFTVVNVCDGVIVVLSALNTVAEQVGDMSFLRMFRVLRLFRALKVVRVVTYFRQLRVLVGTICSSFLSFVWSMAIMILLMLISSLCKTQLIQVAIRDKSNPLELREWLYIHYGTCSRAMFTMFRATFSGGWPNYASRVVEEVSHAWAIFWIMYAAFVVFAIIRIISALFLRDTLASAASDVNMMIEDQIKTKAAYMRKLYDLLEEVDQDGSGTVSFEEFKEIMQEPKTKAWLAVLDITNIDDHNLWKLLEKDGDGIITRDEFVRGIMRIKGAARAHDMVSLRCEIEEIVKLCSAIHMCVLEIKESKRAIPRFSRASAGGTSSTNGPPRQQPLDKGTRVTSLAL